MRCLMMDWGDMSSIFSMIEGTNPKWSWLYINNKWHVTIFKCQEKAYKISAASMKCGALGSTINENLYCWITFPSPCNILGSIKVRSIQEIPLIVRHMDEAMVKNSAWMNHLPCRIEWTLRQRVGCQKWMPQNSLKWITHASHGRSHWRRLYKD